MRNLWFLRGIEDWRGRKCGQGDNSLDNDEIIDEGWFWNTFTFINNSNITKKS